MAFQLKGLVYLDWSTVFGLFQQERRQCGVLPHRWTNVEFGDGARHERSGDQSRTRRNHMDPVTYEEFAMKTSKVECLEKNLGTASSRGGNNSFFCDGEVSC